MNFNLENGSFDLFHPLIIVAMAILFLLIASPMWYFYGRLPAPNLDLYLYIGLGLLFFILGIFAVDYIASNDFKSSEISFPDKISNPQRLSLSDSYSKEELIVVGLVSLGILLQIINIVSLGGIPLFSAAIVIYSFLAIHKHPSCKVQQEITLCIAFNRSDSLCFNRI